MAGGRKVYGAAAAAGRPPSGQGSTAAGSSAAAGEPHARPEDDGGQDQPHEAVPAPAAASGSGTGGGGGTGARPATKQQQAKRWREAKDAFLSFCLGQPTALTKLLGREQDSHLAQLLRAKALLIKACRQAEKMVSGCWGSRCSTCLPFPASSGTCRRPGRSCALASRQPNPCAQAAAAAGTHLAALPRRCASACAQQLQVLELETEVIKAAHAALDAAVAAATQGPQPSLLGAAFAARLLCLLEGMGGIELRRQAWQRLARRFPPPLLEQLTAADFVPPEQEVLLLGSTDLE